MKNISVIGEPSMISKHLKEVFINYAVNAVFKLLPVKSKIKGIIRIIGSKPITMPIALSLSFIFPLGSEI